MYYIIDVTFCEKEKTYNLCAFTNDQIAKCVIAKDELYFYFKDNESKIEYHEVCTIMDYLFYSTSDVDFFLSQNQFFESLGLSETLLHTTISIDGNI